MTLARNLRLFRQYRKLTQVGLKDRSKVSQTTISDIERQRNESSVELPALAKALGVTVDDLLNAQLRTIEDVEPYLQKKDKGHIVVLAPPAEDGSPELGMDGYFSEPSARILALQAGLLAVIRTLAYSPNLVPLLDAELARAKDILAANPVEEPVLAAFDDQAELIRLTADTHHGKRP